MTIVRSDDYYMGLALRQAQKSAKAAEVPVGAIIIDSEEQIIGRGYNLMESRSSQQAHAELRALSQATKKRGGWRLDGCTIYITLEPCMMCLGALLLSRVSRIVYGASSPLFGVVNITTQLQEAYRTHTVIERGVREHDCAAIITAFFSKIRTDKKDA